MHCRSLPWGLILQNFHPLNKAKTDEKGGAKALFPTDWNSILYKSVCRDATKQSVSCISANA